MLSTAERSLNTGTPCAWGIDTAIPSMAVLSSRASSNLVLTCLPPCSTERAQSVLKWPQCVLTGNAHRRWMRRKRKMRLIKRRQAPCIRLLSTKGHPLHVCACRWTPNLECCTFSSYVQLESDIPIRRGRPVRWLEIWHQIYDSTQPINFIASSIL